MAAAARLSVSYRAGLQRQGVSTTGRVSAARHSEDASEVSNGIGGGRAVWRSDWQGDGGATTGHRRMSAEFTRVVFDGRASVRMLCQNCKQQ